MCWLIKPTVKVEFNKKEFEEFLKRMKHTSGSYVTIGVHEGAGDYESGVSVVQVALWNEFGTERIPERSFLRSVLYGNESLINSWRQKEIKEIMEKKTTPEKALSSIGFRIRELVKNKIGSDVPPPNAPSTLARKKRLGVAPRTLIESGLLQRSIDFKVVIK